ncbi:acyl-CoA dehydrogenase/oxidase [Lophiotrema nucula]|uniref:Acyl-coenzyme A oxidase n=1 Tax=Lophiotrema nucula TaxID=690887 RepID=A0A6A5ZP81_9PLEO|nr:acyl-CoA dehydrogenase/oxidase [Lophiotrema nucula]
MPRNPDWVMALRPSGPQGSAILATERASSTIHVDKLADFMFTTEDLQRRARILSILDADPVFNKTATYFLGRIERIKAALARGKRLQQLTVKHAWSDDEYQIAYDLIGEPTPYGLHVGMFTKTLREQGTPEQQERFLQKASTYEIVGCYAQTELGHGSNVRGLETTATWNPDRKTFTLHSPFLTSSKWWIGSLGRAANHAFCMAQLIIGRKLYGPHLFLVQIRDLKSHLPLENIHVGDIGPKFGFNTMDNGFLLFNHVEIPHGNMLARYSHVDPVASQYIPATNHSLVYGTMTWVRSNIVLRSGRTLARGVTIAVRYCAIRRQFQDLDATDSKDENQVLNYSRVQYRLLPLLAATFALHFTGQNMIRMYQANQESMKNERLNRVGEGQIADRVMLMSSADRLAELHAASCALKALTSTTAGEGLETCRRACGGHGYSSFAGIGSTFADYLPTLTWEGDNYMLTQQVSRYLLKTARHVVRPVEGSSSAGNGAATIMKDFRERRNAGATFDLQGEDSHIVDAFAWRVGFLTFDALRRTDDEKQSQNSLLVDFWRLSTAFAQYAVVKAFYDALRQPHSHGQLGADTAEVLRKLFRLYSLHTLSNEASSFLASGACTIAQIQVVNESIMKLMREVRPHAVRLVDAWKLPDWQLDSSLGRADGRVYEDLFHRASELNPLNDIIFDPHPWSKVLFKNHPQTVSSKL